MPDLSKEFTIRTNATLLWQAFYHKPIIKYVVEYFSKKFSDCQKRHSIIKKEATALMNAIEKWSIYLLGKEFTIETDHRQMLWIDDKQS